MYCSKWSESPTFLINSYQPQVSDFKPKEHDGGHGQHLAREVTSRTVCQRAAHHVGRNLGTSKLQFQPPSQKVAISIFPKFPKVFQIPQLNMTYCPNGRSEDQKSWSILTVAGLWLGQNDKVCQSHNAICFKTSFQGKWVK